MGDKQPKCFVPECNNSVGVLFPNSSDFKKKWLKALGVEHLQPNPKSFVCLDHFGENGQPGLRNKKVTSASPAEHRNAGRTSSLSALQQKINKVQKVQIPKRGTLNLPPLKTYKKMGNASSTKLHTNELNIQENIVSQPEDNTAVYSIYEKTCRLCMTQSSNVTGDIFNKLDEKYTIAQAIGVCLYPLQVLPNDILSKNICISCINFLKEYIKFHQTCVAMDKKQRELALVEQNDHSDGNYADSEHSDEYLHEERLSDYEEDKENKEAFKQEITNGQTVKLYSVTSENSFDEKSTPDKVAGVSNVSMREKYDKSKEELLKVLEGNEEVVLTKVNKAKSKESLPSGTSALIRSSISESNDDFYIDDIEYAPPESPRKDDGGYTEDIIIEMVNDEPQPTSPDRTFVDTSKLPITITRVENISPKKNSIKRKRSTSNSFSVKKKMTAVTGDDNEDIVYLPSGISVEVKEPFCSQVGFFKSEPLKYVFNTEYLLAGEYVYEFRLIKNNIRRLHCVVNKCPGTARQSRIRHNEYFKEIEVTKSHNHEPPDHLQRKKQMFYHILYRKMRRDKNFNFKVLYEQFCKLDPGLTEILPLRSVIKEICKQGPAPKTPSLKSFDQFYDLIENDDFHKIHFTDHRVQFYQDRFETQDGAKAVLFGNPEVIDTYSFSKLMYVDASFVIDSEDFPYQLVTVLVWLDQSYYPIFHAFVNKKSQEIYRKIFSFLYNDLAPNLRPHEIITDYEANLYYALGETYVESSIGGSMFYFTQNIYKKICALNLARELELNSNFRSIYNMLLMLPLLPVNTIMDGLSNIEVQAKELDLQHLTDELFTHVYDEWINKVTPELFCVHRLENRINENIVAPFKKLRDFIMLSKNKASKVHPTSSIIIILEKLIDLDKFLRDTYEAPSRKSFTKDLSSTQKRIILKAWNYIENHPMININQFFLKVLGYIKCMENQLWIWGFYRYKGRSQDTLIDVNNFSIVNEDNQVESVEYQEQLEDEDVEAQEGEEDEREVIEEYYIEEGGNIRKIEMRGSTSYVDELTDDSQSIDQQVFEQHSKQDGEEAVEMEAVVDENGGFVVKMSQKNRTPASQSRNTLNDVYK